MKKRKINYIAHYLEIIINILAFLHMNVLMNAICNLLFCFHLTSDISYDSIKLPGTPSPLTPAELALWNIRVTSAWRSQVNDKE